MALTPPIVVKIELDDEFVERVAALVATRLTDNGWPQVHHPTSPMDLIGPAPQQRIEEVGKNAAEAAIRLFGDNRETAEPNGRPEEEEVTPPKGVVSSTSTSRKRELLGIDLRTLKKKIAEAEGKLPSDYADFKKDGLVDYIVKFETLTGKAIPGLGEEPQDIPDDTDDPAPKIEDDTEPEFTSESAFELGVTDFKQLKIKAIGLGVDPSRLSGLDVEAIIDLIFGDRKPQVPVQSQPEPPKVEVNNVIEVDDREYIGLASLGELKELADEYNQEHNAGIVYDNLTKRPDLVVDLLAALDKIEAKKNGTQD